MQKVILLCLLVFTSMDVFSQVRIYKEGTLYAEGMLVGNTANVIHVRTFDGSQFAKRSFFQNSLDSIVVLDSTQIAMLAAEKFRCMLVLRNERTFYDLKNIVVSLPDTTFRTISASKPDDLNSNYQTRLQTGQKHVQKAQTSLIGAITFGALSGMLLSNQPTQANVSRALSSAGIIGVLSGAIGFVLVLNAADQHAKSKSYKALD